MTTGIIKIKKKEFSLCACREKIEAPSFYSKKELEKKINSFFFHKREK
jgi:hypothetical protein